MCCVISDHPITQLSLSTQQSGEVVVLCDIRPSYHPTVIINLAIWRSITIYICWGWQTLRSILKCYCSISKYCEVSPNPNIYNTILICLGWETLRSISKCCEVSPIGKLIITVGWVMGWSEITQPNYFSRLLG